MKRPPTEQLLVAADMLEDAGSPICEYLRFLARHTAPSIYREFEHGQQWGLDTVISDRELHANRFTQIDGVDVDVIRREVEDSFHKLLRQPDLRYPVLLDCEMHRDEARRQTNISLTATGTPIREMPEPNFLEPVEES